MKKQNIREIKFNDNYSMNEIHKLDAFVGREISHNYDEICNLLRQYANKYCKRFSDDIEHDINQMQANIDRVSAHEVNVTYQYIGFREQGTDHNTYIMSRNDMSVYKRMMLVKVTTKGVTLYSVPLSKITK